MDNIALWIALGVVAISLFTVFIGLAASRKATKKKEQGDEKP